MQEFSSKLEFSAQLHPLSFSTTAKKPIEGDRSFFFFDEGIVKKKEEREKKSFGSLVHLLVGCLLVEAGKEIGDYGKSQPPSNKKREVSSY